MENNKRKTKKWFLLLVAVLLTIGIFLFNESNQIKILNFIDSFKMGEKTLYLSNSFNNDNIKDINIYNNNIVLWKDNKLSFMKKDGEIILEETFNLLEPEIYFGEKYIYPFDKTTGDINFLKKNGENLHKLPLGKEIFTIKEIEGHLLCHLKIENTERIEILDKDWVLIGNPTFEDKNILSYDIDKNVNKTIVSVLNLNENMLKSELHYFGENNENQGSLIIEDEIILFNQTIKENSEVVLTDKSLYYIENKEILWKKSFSLIKNIYIRNNMIYLLHSNYLKTINLQGEIKDEVGFLKSYRNIIDFNGSTLVYGDDNLAIVKKGELITEIEEQILKVSTNGRDIIVLGPSSLNVYKLTNKE